MNCENTKDRHPVCNNVVISIVEIPETFKAPNHLFSKTNSKVAYFAFACNTRYKFVHTALENNGTTTFGNGMQ